MDMFCGSMTALVTPFTTQGEVDFLALEELIEWQIQEGTDGIVVCGTTGEVSTLSEEEQFLILKKAVEVTKNRIPIIAGTGTNDTRKTVHLTEMAKKIGADGCLVIVPYYNRPTQEGCKIHYQHVAQVGLPLIVYHHPGRTGVALSVDTLVEICKIPNVVGLKECSGSIDIVRELFLRTKKTLLSGDDLLTLPMMRCGAKGIISVIANLLPREQKEFVSAIQEGNFEKAIKVQQLYTPLCEAIFSETNPQGIKYALSLTKRCNPFLRLPLIEPSLQTKELIRACHEITVAFRLRESPVVERS